MIGIPTYFCILLFIDKVLINYIFQLSKCNWYILHTITNALVVYFTLPDVINMFLDPTYISQDPMMYAMDITMALHIYHMLMFKDLMTIDWIHHIVMLTILSFTYYYRTTIAITNYLLFFLTGLPGGIDYFMLSLVKFDKLDRNMEKYINSKLNIWLRGPGVIVGAYILFIQYMHNIVTASVPTFIFTEIGLFWNAQYFTERVLSNYVYKINFQITKETKDEIQSLQPVE